MKEFEYLRPDTMEEAIAFRTQHEGCSVLLNGGTDIVIQLRDRLIAPEYVIDIKHIPGLRSITFSKEEGLYIGACATMNEVADNEDVKKYYPFLSEAARSVGSKQVRNRATLIGNIVNASPLCDAGTPLYVCEANMCIIGKDGYREVPISEFITFVRRTILKPDEIVAGCKVPYLEGAVGIFTKVSRRQEVDLATICGTVLRMGDSYRMAFGAVAPTPVRLTKTEDLLKGKKLIPELILEAAKLACTEVAPISDIRASKKYRLDVVEVTVKRSLEQLASGGVVE
ncbi:MAG: xanthine dehydrogenase family protein subunit M [Mobilitalea sp.]